MDIRKIAVIGAGMMGGGIAQVAAQSGYGVILEDMKEELVEAGFEKIRQRLTKRVGEGKLDDEEKNKILSQISTTAVLEDCRDADLIIEAVTEKENIKGEIFKKLDAVCGETTVFATNTSSISITRLSRLMKRPDRFIGMHFMNPPYIMKLIEVVKGLRTSKETVGIIRGVSEKMGKVPVVVNDFPGFVSNRVLIPMINEAIFCLQEGIAPQESIDTIMKLGAHHPMGPLELADFIGLDICLEILEILHADLGEKFRPCALLKIMVSAGKLGKKSGEGFYEYR
jgi:3-hydroxybutyryl-CoA dehydrogenase